MSDKRYRCTIYPDGTKICRPKQEEPQEEPLEEPPEEPQEEPLERVGKLKRVIMEFEPEEGDEDAG